MTALSFIEPKVAVVCKLFPAEAAAVRVVGISMTVDLPNLLQKLFHV